MCHLDPLKLVSTDQNKTLKNQTNNITPKLREASAKLVSRNFSATDLKKNLENTATKPTNHVSDKTDQTLQFQSDENIAPLINHVEMVHKVKKVAILQPQPVTIVYDTLRIDDTIPDVNPIATHEVTMKERVRIKFFKNGNLNKTKSAESKNVNKSSDASTNTNMPISLKHDVCIQVNVDEIFSETFDFGQVEKKLFDILYVSLEEKCVDDLLLDYFAVLFPASDPSKKEKSSVKTASVDIMHSHVTIIHDSLVENEYLGNQTDDFNTTTTTTTSSSILQNIGKRRISKHFSKTLWGLCRFIYT